MGEAFLGPAMTARQFETYSKILELTEDQKMAGEALIEGYQDQVRQAREQMRKQGEEIRQQWEETRDPNVWQGMRTMGEKVRAERKKLDEALTNDLKSLLTPQQTERWPAVERAQRRDTTLRRGLMSGERVNLFELVDQLKLADDARTTVNAALAEYEVDLDRALIARNAAYEEGMSKMMELRQGGNMDEMQKLMDRGREVSTRVRDVNRRYARQITDALPESHRAEFEASFKRASFPEVYRPTLAERSFDAALTFEDLSESQRESVRAAKESYTRSLSLMNEKMAAAIEEQESKATIQNMMQRFGGRGNDQGPMGDLRRERREAADAALESLKKVLTPEQAAKLPQREGNGDRERGGEPQMDGPQRRRPRQTNDRT